MSRIKEALLTDNHVNLNPDMIDADYQYEEWLKRQEEEEQYYAWVAEIETR